MDVLELGLLCLGLFVVGSSLLALGGGLPMMVWAMIRALVLRRSPARLFRNRIEMRFLIAANLACVIGAAALFLSPMLPDAPLSQASNVEVRRYDATGTQIRDVLTGDEAMAWQRDQRRGAMIMFTAPVAVSLLPWLFFALNGLRPVVEGLLAALLAAQMMIGMSGYGLAYAPAALLMLLAGVAALRSSVAQATDA